VNERNEQDDAERHCGDKNKTAGAARETFATQLRVVSGGRVDAADAPGIARRHAVDATGIGATSIMPKDSNGDDLHK
jgi:hypothetical protein